MDYAQDNVNGRGMVANYRLEGPQIHKPNTLH